VEPTIALSRVRRLAEKGVGGAEQACWSGVTAGGVTAAQEGAVLTVTRPGGVLEHAGRQVDVAVPAQRALAGGATVRVVLLPAPGPGGF